MFDARLKFSLRDKSKLDVLEPARKKTGTGLSAYSDKQRASQGPPAMLINDPVSRMAANLVWSCRPKLSQR